MDGGKVSLQIPDEWAAIQELKSAEDNYIRVIASRSHVDKDEIDYGDRFVVVNLKEFGKGNSIQFVLSNAVAQTRLGLAPFRIESAGSATGILTGLAGETLPADDEISTEKEDDPFLLLGKVYVPLVADDDAALGLLRIAVTGGEGGSGLATHEVVRSNGGLSSYLNEDGDIVSERRVHAGDDNIYLLFTYAPIETIEDGMLRFVVDSDWDEPQEDSPNQIGFTDVDDAGVPTFENFTVDIPITYIDAGGTPITIHYGVGNDGATAPTKRETSKFRFYVQGSATGTLKEIDAVDVEVYSQGSGEGTASVDTGMMTEDGDPTVHAGSSGSITVTYDPIGEISGGRVKLTVPAALTGGDDSDGVTASHISVPGNAKYGGSVDLDLEANEDVTANDVLVSGVNLRADGTLTFTYTGMMPEATGDLEFAVRC